MTRFISTIPEDNDAIASAFVKEHGVPQIVLFYGEMGIGKTTFIKAICRALGAQTDATSPTFSLVNEYQLPSGKVYHFDLYRMKSDRELYDIGFEEYLDSGSWCLIEWPELAAQILPTGCVAVQMQLSGTDRIITFGKADQ